MILPDFILPSRQNQIWTESGMDSIDLCPDKKHFKSYPYPVEYRYNSRGFRDHEWPTDVNELKNAIWCIGDSFTVGLGSPVERTWTNILEQQTGQRTINVSMDGASNTWIARKTIQILKKIDPKIIVLHWSYTHRRELDILSAMQQRWEIFYAGIKDAAWPECTTLDKFNQLPDNIQTEIQILHNFIITDEERHVHYSNTTSQLDIDNTLNCIKMVELCCADSTKIIHSFIPEAVPINCKSLFEEQLTNHGIKHIPLFDKIDTARDKHHYDALTSQYLVGQIMPLLG